jgi:hypothetical protein
VENIFGGMLVVIISFVSFLIFALPGIFICLIGWRISQKFKDQSIKILVRAGLVSIAITPSPVFSSHSGFLPAIWISVFGPNESRWSLGLIPILIIWAITVGIFYIRNKSVVI